MIQHISVTLRVWRQPQESDKGCFESYEMTDVSTDISFLELLDILNERLISKGIVPVAFDHDCREGICGTCGAAIGGRPHGPLDESTLCQLHMREFNDGDVITVEPYRANAFPLITDLVVDRSGLDRIIASGGYISVRAGAAADAHSVPVSDKQAEKAFESAACIGCGACVAACPNGSANLFIGSKISHLAALPQGEIGSKKRALLLNQCAENNFFGHCRNERICEKVCPKGISVTNISKLNREYIKSSLRRLFF